ncbi:MAG: acyl carrier protein [Bryobacterales bacterium]|nr:acyl carrier protein [Bryobacterales bacterium]
MNEITQRLTRCFLAVFPGLSEDAVATASQETVGAWDSLASITLVRVIEEEFGVSIDLFELEDLLSFNQLKAHLEAQVGA